MSIKAERVASEIVKEISAIILTESDDTNFKNVSITAAEVTNDLSYAKIYFTSLDENRDEIIKEINEASSFFRTLLAERLDVRQIPELKFIYDESIEYAEHIEKIIDEINNK